MPPTRVRMHVLLLPRELLIHVLRCAAMDEDDFRTTVTVRGSVCKDLFAASEAWMIAHDAGAAMPSIAGEKLKERRYVRAVRLIRQNQLHTEPVLLSVLSTQEELDTAMHLQRLECAAFDELSSALFCTAWPIVQDRYRFRFHGHGYDLTWRCPEQPHDASPFRVHLRRAALSAAVNAIEADAVHLLKAALMSAVHRGTQAESHERANEGPDSVVVGSNDVRFAASLLGRQYSQALTSYSFDDDGGMRARSSNYARGGNAAGAGLPHYDSGMLTFDMDTLLPAMAAMLPAATIDLLVARLAKRAGICRHTVRMVDEVWRLMIDRYASVLVRVGYELHHIAMCETGGDIDEPVEYEEEGETALRKVPGSEDDDYDEDEDDEEETDADGELDDEESDVEGGDDADARWDEVHREWVLLPSSKMIGKLYGLNLHGV